MKLKSSLQTCSIGTELFLHCPESDQYLHLNPTGRRIWEILPECESLAGVVTRLTEEYKIDPKECEVQVRAFCQELAERGLLLNLIENPE